MNTWNYPMSNRYIPKGGEFLSWYLDNGQKRTLAHSGVDYSRYEGSDIFFIGTGTVIKQGTNTGGWGYYTYVDHGVYSGSKRIYSYYAHMQAKGLPVGTKVTSATKAGKVGKTGNVTGAHLHWGVAIATPQEFDKYVFPMGAAARNYLVDPEKFIADMQAKPVPPPVDPTQRQVGSIETRQRTEPTTKASYDHTKNLKAGTIITPLGWVTGENVQGSTVWFKTPAGLYSHSSGFTNKTTTGLKDLNRTPLDDAKDALREALKANEEATKNLASSSGKIEEALKL